MTMLRGNEGESHASSDQHLLRRPSGPNGQQVIFAGAGHYLQLEKAQAVAGVILSLLAAPSNQCPDRDVVPCP